MSSSWHYEKKKFCYYCGAQLGKEVKGEKPYLYDPYTGQPYYYFRKWCPNWNRKDKHDVLYDLRAVPNE